MGVCAATNADYRSNRRKHSGGERKLFSFTTEVSIRAFVLVLVSSGNGH